MSRSVPSGAKWPAMSCQLSPAITAKPSPLSLDAPAGLENPPDEDQAGGEEHQRHAEADRDADVGMPEKAPAEARHKIEHRVEQADRLPDRRQHVDRIETAAEKGKRRDDEQRNELQLLEIGGPDADDEAEQ